MSSVVEEEHDPASKRETFGTEYKSKKNLKLNIPSSQYATTKGKRSQRGAEPEYDTPQNRSSNSNGN